MTSVNINEFLIEQGIQPEIIRRLLIQGIEIEKLRLEVSRCTDSDSLSIRINILEGERLSTLFLFSGT